MFLAGQRLTADLLNAANGLTYTKVTTENRSSTTTFADDAELKGIPLGVGTWEIDVMLYWFLNPAGAGGIKTMWAFSGTWAALIRSISGPGSSNTAGGSVLATSSSYGQRENASVPYGVAAGTSYAFSREMSRSVVVSTAGNFSVQWAQNTSSVNALSVGGQSTVSVRQLA